MMCSVNWWQLISARITIVLGLCICSPLAAQTNDGKHQDPTDENLRFFESRIHAVLIDRCYQCHSQQAAEIEGGLLLDTRDGLRRGGDSGPAVVPGDANQSLLLQRIMSVDDPMPPDHPLEPEVIESFRLWIVGGAVDSRDSQNSVIRDPDYTEARQHWAFQPVNCPPIPSVRDGTWPSSPIDNFVLRELESHDLRPAQPATPEALIRRVWFDLIGLPPTPEQVDRFAKDPSPAAYLGIVNRLLESPQYGERWAQHWLDVVRYAETEGFEYDRTLPDVWRFRDYVIESLNADKPFDRFLTEQLAGDELNPDDPKMRIAAGFHRLGAVRRNAGNQLVASSRDEVLTERTDIIGSVVLGLTIGCARCHDHKFDPIPQQDYYRLKAFFAASQEHNISLRDDDEHARLLAFAEKLEAEIAELKENLSGLTGADEERVRAQISKLEEQLPPPGPTICSIQNEFDELTDIHLLRRGDPDLPGPRVGMRMPGVLIKDSQAELPVSTSTPRTLLAQELTDPNQPLTARVIVNRIWQNHFGVGLVSTSNDFGRNGSPPSHPELLDYLAHQFVAGGWHLKPLHRIIVTSSSYRQSSKVADASGAMAQDPENRWLWRFPRRRLSGEEIRDAMLDVAGKLNPEMGGASVMLPVEQELVDQLYKPTQWQIAEDKRDQHRRSIYLFAKRNLRLPFMEVFDQPSSQTSCANRIQSTHARQALEMLNGAIANEMADAFAQRLVQDVGSHPALLVRRAYRLTTARLRTREEQSISEQFIADVGVREYALAMLNINAFLYID